MIGRLKETNLKIKCLFLLALIVVICLSGWGGLLLSNKYAMENRKSGLVQVEIDVAHIELINWDLSEKGAVSQLDPMLILHTGETYIAQICLKGTIGTGELTPRIYYKEKGQEDFSEERSFVPEFEQEGAYLYLSINRFIEEIRIDLTEAAGLAIDLQQVVLNPREYNVTVKTVLYACLLGACSLTLSALGYTAFMLICGGWSAYLDTFLKYRYLLWNLVSRDVKVKYRRSVLGIVWSVLNPLLMMLVITAVFENLFRYNIEHFPVYYLTGSLLFNFVTDATGNAMTSILYAAPLIRKVHVPKYIFPMEKCIFALVNMLFSSIATIIVLAILRFKLSLTALLFSIPVFCAFAFSVGIGMILATLNVFFRDTGHLYGVWTTAWFYLTPIIYPVDILPPIVVSLVKLNPQIGRAHV